jgi:NAD(P)-dependent dehydrogenase (short-subunit alcohol dehydrogenase family)
MADVSPAIDLDFSLKGKRALVTGGASGIGAAICDAFAAKGVRTAVADLNAVAAEAKAKEIGHGAIAIPCDVADPASVKKAVDSVVTEFGGLDILVNSAGVVFLAPGGGAAARLLGHDDRHQSEGHIPGLAGRWTGDDRRWPRRQDHQYRLTGRFGRHRSAPGVLRLQVRSDRSEQDFGGRMGQAPHLR